MAWKTAIGIPANRQSNQDDTKELKPFTYFFCFWSCLTLLFTERLRNYCFCTLYICCIFIKTFKMISVFTYADVVLWDLDIIILMSSRTCDLNRCGVCLYKLYRGNQPFSHQPHSVGTIIQTLCTRLHKWPHTMKFSSHLPMQ